MPAPPRSIGRGDDINGSHSTACNITVEASPTRGPCSRRCDEEFSPQRDSCRKKDGSQPEASSRSAGAASLDPWSRSNCCDAGNERPLQFLRVPAARRSSYQRRNVSRARQIERGERPNLGTAVESNRARIARLTDEQVIEQFQLRVRQLWPNSENYENSFRRLDHLPDLVRVMSTLSDSQLRTLIVQREGADFNIELAHMMRVQMAPVAVTRNPLHYHDSSRTDYGIEL